MPYSATTDLLLGDMPLSAALNKDKFVADAADEIDSAIGAAYVTPILMAEPVPRHVQLHIKRINNFLATGRLILAIGIGGEDSQLHAYGLSLVTEARQALQAIVEGSYPLVGVVPQTDPNATAPRTAGPTVTNTDASSSVDAFYGFVSEPRWGSPTPRLAPLWRPGP